MGRGRRGGGSFLVGQSFNNERDIMKSWKTTLFGVLTALGAYLQTVQDPAWLQMVGKALTVAGPILLGLFARDNSVTSESAGAK
jgi:hypothetical protein